MHDMADILLLPRCSDGSDQISGAYSNGDGVAPTADLRRSLLRAGMPNVRCVGFNGPIPMSDQSEVVHPAFGENTAFAETTPGSGRNLSVSRKPLQDCLRHRLLQQP